jgi:protoheme IX farnesyltransferase
MLPITHGQKFTRLHILLYSFALLATTLLPYIVGMSGWLYLIAAVVLGLIFIGYAFKLYRVYSDELSRKLFRFSILYLSLLFAALLADHWLIMVRA